MVESIFNQGGSMEQETKRFERWMVTIRVKIESGNKLLRAHWGVRRDLKKKYMKALQVALHTPPAFASRLRHLDIISYRKRLLDKDNLYTGAKLLIDALKELGWLYDDAPQYLKLRVTQRINTKNPRTVICIGGEVYGFQVD